MFEELDELEEEKLAIELDIEKEEEDELLLAVDGGNESDGIETNWSVWESEIVSEGLSVLLICWKFNETTGDGDVMDDDDRDENDEEE